MRIEISNVIVVYDITPDLKEWVEKNLTFRNPEYATRIKLKKFVGNCPKTFRVYHVDDRRYVLPYGILRKILPYIQGHEIITKFKEPVKVDYGHMDLKLYDYQETAVNVAIGKKFGIVKSPAGSGKTTMGVAMIQRMGLKALWLTHTQELLDQAKNRAEQFFDDSLIGTIEAGKVNISKGVTFAMIQTMEKLDLSEFRNTWDLIIVDECHRICVTPKSVGMFYKVLNALSARHKYGISATLSRHDGLHGVMFAAVGEVIWEVPPETVADKIMKAKVQFMGTNMPFEFNMVGSDGIIRWDRMIDCLCLNSYRNELIVENITEEVRADHYCLVLSDRIQHSTIIRDMLPEDIQEECVIINGHTNKDERKEGVELVRSGKKHIFMASFNLAKEGLDIPILDRLFMCTPHQQFSVVVQSIGRVQRKHPHKTDALIYDYVDENLPNCMKAYKNRRRIYVREGCEIANAEE